MNFDDAVSAHVAWKIAFRAAVNRKHAIDAPLIAHDDRCVLGQWLHGEARRRYGTLPAYCHCLEAHARFHREAGRIAHIINRGDFAAAEAELDGDAPSGEASALAVAAINQFRRAL